MEHQMQFSFKEMVQVSSSKWGVFNLWADFNKCKTMLTKIKTAPFPKNSNSNSNWTITNKTKTYSKCLVASSIQFSSLWLSKLSLLQCKMTQTMASPVDLLNLWPSVMEQVVSHRSKLLTSMRMGNRCRTIRVHNSVFSMYKTRITFRWTSVVTPTNPTKIRWCILSKCSKTWCKTWCKGWKDLNHMVYLKNSWIAFHQWLKVVSQIAISALKKSREERITIKVLSCHVDMLLIKLVFSYGSRIMTIVLFAGPSSTNLINSSSNNSRI